MLFFECPSVKTDGNDEVRAATSAAIFRILAPHIPTLIIAVCFS
jgi:TPP-dependent pyruvate/acetoin dehydrogenase alpha subunit